MSVRLERVAEEMKKEISRIIHDELKDPRVGFVTIMRVEVTADLRQAKVFASCLGTPEQKAASLAGLSRATGFVRRLIGDRIKLRYNPELLFVEDETVDRQLHMSKLIDDLRPPPPPPSIEETPNE